MKKCSEIFSTPLGKLVPKLLPLCLFVCLFVHLYLRIFFFSVFLFFSLLSVCLFVYIPLFVCLLLVSLYSHDLVLNCPTFLLTQVRHGAATALREIIKLHGETAGISVYTHSDKVESP